MFMYVYVHDYQENYVLSYIYTCRFILEFWPHVRMSISYIFAEIAFHLF